MKKLLFFLSTILFLSACSSDSDPTNSPDTNQTKYAISINAALPNFKVENSPLKATVADGEPSVYSLVVYKENGEVYYNWWYDPENNWTSNGPDYDNLFTFDENRISTMILLPAGGYHIALLIHRKDVNNQNTTRYPLINTENYNTDNYGASFETDNILNRHNGGVYFNTVDLTVVASVKDQNISMVLQPMWSYVDLSIDDAQTFGVPEGTNAIQFEINPLYYGINVKTMLAPFADTRPIIVSLDTIRTNPKFNLRTTMSKSILEDNTIGAKIKYLKIENDTTVLETKQLPIPNSNLDNGFIYNIHGALGSANNNQSFNISLGSFSEDEVVIEF